MDDNSASSESKKLAQIIESAHGLGVEISETEALQWLAAMAVESESEISMDLDAGVFGHKVVMLDFSPAELARFREIGRLVEFQDQPGVVETALALSGSSFLVERALSALNPPIPRGVIVASAPPAIITSTTLCLIQLQASPRAWAADEQAVVEVIDGPFALYLIEICPGARLEIIEGMK